MELLCTLTTAGSMGPLSLGKTVMLMPFLIDDMR